MVSTIFLNIIKAFDTVDHDPVLLKCEFYGIRGHGFNFLRAFLSGRLQYIQIDSKRSSSFPITCGVSQGSVLEPLL